MNPRDVVDRFFSIRTGVSIPDLKPGQVGVGTCDRRTYAELGFGFTRLLWVLGFGDRAAVSVHPAALAEVSQLAWGKTPDEVMGDDFVTQAGDALRASLPSAALHMREDSVVMFYHPGDAPAVPCGGCIRALTAGDRAKWVGDPARMTGTEHPGTARGETFGVLVEDKLVAEVITHEPSVAEMAHLIAEDGIGVAEAYRRRGYGKALLAFWTREMQARGRVCLHGTSPGNAASVALARSVGYVEYCRKRGWVYNPPEG